MHVAIICKPITRVWVSLLIVQSIPYASLFSNRVYQPLGDKTMVYPKLACLELAASHSASHPLYCITPVGFTLKA